MQLDSVRARLHQRLRKAEDLFSSVSALGAKRNRDHRQLLFLDGLLSYTWQSWCRFCRDLVVHSCVGAETSAGIILPASVTPATPERVSHLAIQAKRYRGATPGVNAARRNEPTWGDVDCLLRIVGVANPANASQLQSSFGTAPKGPTHLQKVRNAAAHLHDQSFAEVRAIQVYYLSTQIRFPCEACFWVDSVASDFAFIAWVDDMRLLSQTAVQ